MLQFRIIVLTYILSQVKAVWIGLGLVDHPQGSAALMGSNI